jgi:AraC-like DNA-binding protein/mannose-6-phosphate isomerase-like protein (cupin superfamily)
VFYQDQHFGISEYFCKETGENFSFPAHLHHSFEFVAVLEGEMTVTVDGFDYELLAGDGVLIFPEQIHSLRSERSKHCLVIFSPDTVSAYGRKHSTEVPCRNQIKVPEYIVSQILAIDENSSVIKKKAMLYGICALMDETVSYKEKRGGERGLLRAVFDFVENNYESECNLQSLSRALGYNEAYLSRYFKEITGISYTSYVNRYRVSKACYLLRNTDKTILECSGDCGYRSLRNFNRNFKSMIGKSPNEYRR